MLIAKQIVSINKRLIICLLAFAVAFAFAIGGTQGANANQPAVVTGEQIDVSGINFRGTILEDVKMHGGTKWEKCHWVNGGFNSGRSVSGELQWFHDPVRAKICRNPHSPTGWVKVDGGQTGRNCGNPFKPHGHPPGPVVKGPVVMVRNFNKVNMNAVARAEVSLKEDIVCPDGSTLSAQSTGLAVSKVRVNQQMLMSAHGNVDNLEAQLKSDAKAKAIAQAQGKIEATCGTVDKQSPPEEPEKPVVVPAVSTKESPPPKPKPEPEPVSEVPEELPDTGPGAVAAGFVGISSLASLIYYVIARRLGQ
ncbi:MAG TPA: hypothetical protein VFX86_04515 [Candidatus Saccharimonadales bacterium]|nr:hypothetical protein [Candidatus Saccharimonadales bacterium]